MLVLAEGEDREPQPAIAGGYDVIGANACLGAKFDVKQSGQFVNFDNAKGTLGGKLEFDEGELTGDVDCIERRRRWRSTPVAADGEINGTLGGEEFEARAQARGPRGRHAQAARAGLDRRRELQADSALALPRVQDRDRGRRPVRGRREGARPSASSSTTTARSRAR